MSITLTTHASTRLRQRGIQGMDVGLLLQYATNSFSHKDCDLVSLGKKGEHDLAASGVSRQAIDRLKRTALVVAQDNGAVVTAMKLYGRTWKRYVRSI